MEFICDRELIIEKACEIFKTHEYDIVSVEMISNAAGISIASIYEYFSTKEALLESCLLLYAEAWKKQNMRLLQNMENALEAIDSYVNNRCNYITNTQKNYLLFAAKSKIHKNNVIKGTLQEFIKDSTSFLIKVLEQGKENQQICSHIDSTLIAKLLVINFSGLNYCYHIDSSLNIDELSSSFIKMLKNRITKHNG